MGLKFAKTSNEKFRNTAKFRPCEANNAKTKGGGGVKWIGNPMTPLLGHCTGSRRILHGDFAQSDSVMAPMPKAERASAVTDRAPVADRASAVRHCPKIFEIQYVVSL